MPEQFRHMKMPNFGDACGLEISAGQWLEFGGGRAKSRNTISNGVTHPLRTRSVTVHAYVVSILLLDIE